MGNKIGFLEYVSASPKHLILHKSTKKVRALLGGNRAGKTRWGAQEVCWHIFGLHPYQDSYPHPRNVRICVTNEQQGIKSVMLPVFFDILPPGSWNWKAEPRVLDVAVGDGKTSHIEFLTYEQSLDKWGGTSRTLILMDEEPHMRDQYVQNLMRTVDSHGKVLVTMTPLFGMTFMYEEICEGDLDLVDYEHISIYDNKFLPREEIELIEKSIDRDSRDAVIYGRFISPSGLVYKDFDTSVHVIDELEELDPEWMIVLGIDTHEARRNEQAVVFCAITKDDHIIVFDEILRQCLIPELAEDIQNKLSQWDADYRFAIMDISAESAITGVNHKAVLQKAGLKKIKVADKSKGTPQEGRSKIKQMLKWEKDEDGDLTTKPQIYFTQNCGQIIREMKHYLYDNWKGRTKDQRNPKEDVRKKDDHLVDALRYIVHENIHFRKAHFVVPKPQFGGKHLIRGVQFKAKGDGEWDSSRT